MEYRLLQQMSMVDFAAFERLLGQRVVRANDCYWSQVRPCFFRPLLPTQEYRLDAISAPWSASLGGFQCAVPPKEKANSSLNLLLFDSEGYSLDSLDYNRKRQVKLAQKQFDIRPMTDVSEFKKNAYPIYLSFYERTRYYWGAKRRDRTFFSHWADALFQMPKVLILGGYQKGELRGVSLSLLVEDTLLYATFFCDTHSMRLYLSDLMLHAVRNIAAEHPHVRHIFAGMCKAEEGLNDFYLLRGCNIVRKRAVLRVNPLAAFALRNLMPKQYATLQGGFNGAQDL
jgi:hypothetical protein